MKHRMWIILALTAAILAALYFWPRGEHRRGDMKIVCTTYPVWLFTRALTAGTGAPEPVLLVPAGTGCPHDYALTTGDMLKLNGAARLLLVRNGGGLDDVIYEAAKKAEPGLYSADSTAGFAVPGQEKHEESEAENPHGEEGRHHHASGGADPHLFTAPHSAKHMVRRIAGALREFDPARAEKYAENEKKLLGELDRLERETEELAGRCRGVKILAMHDTFTHLMNVLGFEFEGVVSEEHNPSLNPAELAALIDRIKKEEIGLLVTEPQIPAQLPEKLRQETGIRVIELDSAASGPESPEPDHYLRTVRANLRRLRDALPPQK